MKLGLGWFAVFFASCAASEAQRLPESDDYADSASGADGYFLGVSALASPAVKAEPAEALIAPKPVADPAAVDGERSVIYSAALRLVVVSAREAFASIRSFAREAGGHLQESDARSITIRVPAKEFEAVVARIAGLGEVVDNAVRASDVTEEMLDLGIRLENARKARERLIAHLDKSDMIEDTLKIEQELARVTGEIEQLEGRLRYMQSQIAMSTIRVELNTTKPQRSGDGPEVPFEWIERLGDGLVAGTVQGMPRKPRLLSKGPSFDPPDDFVRYYRNKDLVEAMNADGVRLKLQEHENYDEGALVFWYQLARNALVRGRALAITEERDLDKGQKLIAGTRDVGGQVHAYLLVLTRTDDHVYAFEAWGPQEAFARSSEALIASARSLRK